MGTKGLVMFALTAAGCSGEMSSLGTDGSVAGDAGGRDADASETLDGRASARDGTVDDSDAGTPSPSDAGAPTPRDSGPPPTTALGQLAASMSAGEWATLETENFEIIRSRVGGDVLEYANSASWDAEDRKLYFIGAAHHGEFDTKFIEYDEATNRWSELADPGINAVHGYDHNAFDSTRGTHYFWPPRAGYVLEYDETEDSWSELPHFDRGVCIGVAEGLVYYPEMDRLMLFNARCGYEIFSFDPEAETWTKTSYELEHQGNYHTVAEYLPHHGIIMFGGGNEAADRFYRMDSEGTITLAAQAPIPVAIPFGWAVPDPVTGNLLAFATEEESSRGYEYDPEDDEWRELAAPGPLARPSSAVITAVPEHGVVMLAGQLSGQGLGVWLYKHAE
jgi:hypothetical protein